MKLRLAFMRISQPRTTDNFHSIHKRLFQASTLLLTVALNGIALLLLSGTSVAQSAPAAMRSPKPGTTLPGTTQTFTWTAGTRVTQIELLVGTTLGGGDIYSNGAVTGTSITVNNLPTNGSTVYVRLWSLINGIWQFNDYTYTAAAGVQSFPSSNHVFVIMEENQSFSEVFPSGRAINCASSSMPYLCGLAATNGMAANFYSNQHDSLLTYLYATSAATWTQSPFNCNGLTCVSIGAITGDNFPRALTAAGKTWRGYFEGMPSQGYLGGDTSDYVLHHNPFPWYSDVANSVTQQDNMYPFTQFATDVRANSFQNFSFIVPNVLNDADGIGSQSSSALLGSADAWLKTNIAPLLSTAPFKPGGDGILIVTFDEGSVAGKSGNSTTDGSCSPTQSSGCGGHVVFVMIGPNVNPGSTTSNTYHWQNMVHTVIHLLGMADFMNNSNGAADIALLPGVR
jgi:phosphatidylinositol-3-phosphatase